MNEDLGLLFSEADAMSALSSPNEISQLRKALATGYEMGTTDQTGFGAIRVESLEQTLKIATVKEKSATFWKAIKKSKGKSTVEEFSILNELGEAGFYIEGGLPEEYDEEIKREFEQTKYVGAVGKVPNVAMSIQMIAGPMAVIQEAKAIAIIRQCDVKSFFGNSTNNSVEWNGFLKQFNARAKYPTQNTIDLRGKRLSPETLNQVGLIIQNNYGDPNNLKGWIAPQAFKDYTDELIANKQYFLGNSNLTEIIAAASKWRLGNGSGDFETDIFLRHKGETNLNQSWPRLNSAGTAFAATHSKAPTTLASGVCTATPGADTTSLLPAATYDYAFLAGNKYGVSAAFEILDVVVGANEKVTFVISDNGSPSGQEATFFEVYRRLATSTDKKEYQFLTTFAAADTKIDNGEHIPGTTYGFFYDWDMDQVLDIKQLLPMVKMPLATIDDSVRWLQKLYATPILYNPNKMVLFKNIGSIAN